MFLWSLPVERYLTQVPLLSPEDSLSKAAALLRVARTGVLPVVHQGRLVGLLAEADVAHVLMGGNPEESRYLPVSAAMVQDVPLAFAQMPTSEALRVMRDSGLSSLPVVSEDGCYIGMVLRSDVLALACEVARPPLVGGMATPVGVYLTGGGVRAGAGDLGLFLSGALLMLFNLLAFVAVYSGTRLIQQHTGIPLYAMLMSPTASLLDWQDWVGMVLRATPILLFLLFVRLSPIAGLHAAEHMTVHAIEQGELLSPEYVRRMPRVHPRCGTNLAAGALVFLALASVGSGIYRDLILLVALVTTIIIWRPLGNLIQALFTTRQPSERQLFNAIQAGRKLLERYQAQGYRPLTFRERIWNMGLLQVATGMLSVWWITSRLGLAIW